jgi:hypothetical protein
MTKIITPGLTLLEDAELEQMSRKTSVAKAELSPEAPKENEPMTEVNHHQITSATGTEAPPSKEDSSERTGPYILEW